MSIKLTGAMLALTLGVGNSPSDIKLGEIREFGDWVSGCDNALSCEAVALSSGGRSAVAPSLLLFRERALGTGADGAPLVIKLEGLPNTADRYRLFIDGDLVDTGGISPDTGEVTVRSQDAVRLADAIARGKFMRITDGADAQIASFSLKGSSASLRHIDAQLGLVGTRQAIVAQGQRKAKRKDAELPVVVAKRVSSDGNVPEAIEVIDFADSSACNSQRIGVTEDRTYSLGSRDGYDHALVLISCGNGAYNYSSAAYIATSKDGGKWSFKPAEFDLPPRKGPEPANLALLFNAEWNADNQSLSSNALTRGLGDCGDTSEYVWDGDSFRLSQARSMPSCRGTLNWITVWRAKVIFRS